MATGLYFGHSAQDPQGEQEPELLRKLRRLVHDRRNGQCGGTEHHFVGPGRTFYTCRVVAIKDLCGQGSSRQPKATGAVILEFQTMRW